jgi:formate dehydrogenase assembly factor FdhD
VDIPIEEGPVRNYKTNTLEEHLKMEKVDKEKLLDRLNELNDEVFTFKHHHGSHGAKLQHKEDVL